MKTEMQKKLVAECPLLYKHFKGNPKMQIDCPDDLFEFIFELSNKIEDFNKRFPKRRMCAMKVTMEFGELVFITNRQIFTIKKLISATASQIKTYRRNLKKSLFERAKAIQTTALFDSRLIPDWKRLMPDDLAALQKILQYAERCACVPQDYVRLANWYKKLLKDEENYELFLQRSKQEV